MLYRALTGAPPGSVATVHARRGAPPLSHFPSGPTTPEDDGMSVVSEPFGNTPDGRAVELYSLTNAHGMRMRVMTYGATVVSLETPDRDGKPADVVLGFDTLAAYIEDSPYFGAACGRYANRIANATFTLDGERYELAANDGANSLHGGLRGLDKVVWQAEPTGDEDDSRLLLTVVSPDGDEGYPGALSVAMEYELTDANEFRITYRAETDKATPVNLTNHSYFNLAGAGTGDVLGHVLTVHADRYTPVDEGLIPTGELRSLDGSALDFRAATAIGARIGDVPGGYDHNYVLRGQEGSLALAAEVREPGSGRTMAVLTTEPGVQLYTGNFLDGSHVGKGALPYKQHYGFCLETQHYPDSPNQPGFPSTILRPGAVYRQTTVYRFAAE